MRHRPKDRVAVFGMLLFVLLPFLGTHRERLDLTGTGTVNGVNRSRKFQMHSRLQQRAVVHRTAEPFEKPLFARADEHHRGGEPEQGKLQKHDPGEGFLEKPVEPGFRHLESELVIKRLCSRGHQTFGMPEQSDQPALVERTGGLALDSGTVDLEHQIDQVLDGGQGDDAGKDAGGVQIEPRKSQKVRGVGHCDDETDIRTQQQVAGTGPQQARVLQLRQAGRIFANHEQDQCAQPEKRHRNRWFRESLRRDFHQPGRQEIGHSSLDQEEEHREHREKHPFELLPGPLSGQNLDIGRRKQPGATLRFGELLKFELLQPLGFLQPHLNVADAGDQQAEPQHHQPSLTGQGLGIKRKDRRGGENHHRHNHIDQPSF